MRVALSRQQTCCIIKHNRVQEYGGARYYFEFIFSKDSNPKGIRCTQRTSAHTQHAYNNVMESRKFYEPKNSGARTLISGRLHEHGQKLDRGELHCLYTRSTIVAQRHVRKSACKSKCGHVASNNVPLFGPTSQQVHLFGKTGI